MGAWLRRRWAVVAIIGVLCVALGAATGLLFVWPATTRPQKADAIVVFGGDGPRRDEGALLVREGIAPILAESVASPLDFCYRQRKPVEPVCFRARPLTTQGEARWVAMVARAQGWHRVLIVVSAPQATRARIRIRRCYRDGLQIVAVHLGPGRTLIDAIYEWGALLKALTLQRRC